MSVAGISGNLFNFQSSSAPSSNPVNPTIQQEFGQDFKQLGQDLQSGNVSAATADLAAIQKLEPQSPTGGTAAWYTNSPQGQEFSQMSQALQSGNLAAAQQDYSQIQTQNHAAHEGGGHHHHLHGEAGGANSLTQAIQALGQALQSGNLTSAQQAYATVQQDLPQFAQTSPAQTTPSQSTTTGVSATA
jgi:hypothetical protein